MEDEFLRQDERMKTAISNFGECFRQFSADGSQIFREICNGDIFSYNLAILKFDNAIQKFDYCVLATNPLARNDNRSYLRSQMSNLARRYTERLMQAKRRTNFCPLVTFLRNILNP